MAPRAQQNADTNKKKANVQKKKKGVTSTNVETEVKAVLNNCKAIVDSNNAVLKSKDILRPMECKKDENKENANLDTVTKDISLVLKNLKESLVLMKSSKNRDSFSDVVLELEETCQKTGSFFTKKRSNILQAHKEEKNSAKPNKQIKKPVAKNNNSKKPSNQNNSPKTVIEELNRNNKNVPPKNVSSKSAPSGQTRPASPVKIQPRPESASGSQRSHQTNSNTSRTSSFFPSIPREVYNPLGPLKDEVQRAIKNKKTFTIRGNFPAVRRALLQRGWVEKFHITYKDVVSNTIKQLSTYSVNELADLLRNKDITDTCKKLIKSKLLKDHQVDFYWDYSYDSFRQCNDKIKFTLINKFRREVFSYTSKQGLCEAAKDAYWYRIPGVSNINHPRSYLLTKNGDTKTFVKDFNITAAMSMLKWIVRNNITKEIKIISPSGKIPVKVFDFAVTECYKFLKKSKHDDIDFEIPEALEHEWNEFLSCYYKTVHIGNHFKKSDNVTEQQIVRKANYVLNELKEYWPYFEMDGMMNIWILKPTNSSRGQGIHICRALDYVLKTIQDNPNRRYIIQKYIERPLLIHDTKFDIRQWFLITNAAPVTIWMYKSCYLRFSSQTYNLRKLHESIHLTNNSVQVKYMRNVAIRDVSLPVYNMWDSTQFKNFLSNIGYPTAFDSVIYPGMKESIVAAVLAHQDKIDRRKCCFELYGADFMLTEDFRPWLLEINSNPALHASTPVTAKMCPKVLEDVIKVVVDNARNSTAETGLFEQIYKGQVLSKVPPSKGLQLTGKQLPEDYFFTPSYEKTDSTSTCGKCTSLSTALKTFEIDPCERLRDVGDTMKKTLENLLDILHKEKQRRFKKKSKMVEAKDGKPALETYTQTMEEKKEQDFIELYKSDIRKEISTTFERESKQRVSAEMKQLLDKVLSRI